MVQKKINFYSDEESYPMKHKTYFEINRQKTKKSKQYYGDEKEQLKKWPEIDTEDYLKKKK